jgi:hypothetical protein
MQRNPRACRLLITQNYLWVLPSRK